jgi:tetratricopeptide (TPR) repeat protein
VLGIVAGIGLIATGIGFVFISRGGLESVVPQARIDAWRITMRMIAAKPWLGIDLGTYGQEFINQRMGHETTIIHLHPHNEVLNAAVYLGLSGAALTLVSLAAFGKLGVQMLRRLEIKRLGNFALIGLIGYAVHGMVDSFINVFQVGALVLFLAVSLIGFRDRKIAYREDAYRMVWLTAMAVLVGAGALFQIWRLAPYEKARQAAAVGDIDSAAAWIDTALARDQENAYYHHTKAVLLGRKAVVEQVALDQAVSQFARSTAYYPGWAPDRYNYALLLSAQGQHGKALQELKAAISKFPDIAFYHCAAAEELEAVGWDHEAVQYYGSCLALSPGSRNLPYWGKSQVRQEHFTQIRSRAETYLADQDNASDNYRLRFYHHLGTQAQYDSFVERLPDSTALTNQQLAYRGSAHLEEGNWSSAEKVFLEMLESYPRSKAAWDGLAESYLGSGQEEIFEQAAKISLALGGSSRTFTLVGLHHEQVSRPEEAIDAYQLAMIYFTYPHRERKFATWTARRYPFPITWIGELPSLYSEYGYQLALERYSKLVANKSCQEQMRLHRQIIWNTANPSVISQLVDRSSSTDCD